MNTPGTRAINRSDRTLVVIEDDKDLAEMLSMLLEAEGYIVHHAFTGKTGIALAARSGAHAVLLDYMLPDMTGAEVGNQLRCDPATSNLKIFMCTSTSEETVRPFFSDYEGYFIKPVQHTQLVRALDAAFGATCSA